MTLQEEVTALRGRFVRAESERSTWRASGMQEKYLEACSLVDALELQLEAMRQDGLRRVVGGNDSSSDPSIAFDGRYYRYGRYRYDRLADALDYARLQRATPSGSDEGDGPMPPVQAVETPDASQREVMAELSITFHDGRYHLGEYRYDRLVDAANYARLQLREKR
jgi:hypothetical protein